jgi:hypothetical protein
MSDQIENPVIKTDEQEQKFLEAAALADAGRDIPADLVPGVKTEAAPEKKDEPIEQSGPIEAEKKDERPRDALGRFTKTEEGEDIPEAERKPAEPPKKEEPKPGTSEYEAKKQERAQKEQQRLEKTWENVNRQKDELVAREKALAQQQQSMQQQAQRPQANQQREFSSRDLWAAAQDFKTRAKKALEESNFDEFNENNALAEQAEQHARQFYQIEAREAQQAQVEQYNQVWSGHMQKAIEADPDLVKQDSPLAKEMHALLERHGQVFWMIPDGFPKGVEIAKLRLKAGSADKLDEANKKLQTEVNRLNEQLSLGGGGVTTQPARKKFEEMSAGEQEKSLLAAATAVDEGRT